MIKVLLLIFLVIILLFTTLKYHENFDTNLECNKYSSEKECPEIRCVFENNKCLSDKLRSKPTEFGGGDTIVDDFKTSSKIVCETIEDPNDCINYGCDYKEFTAECNDGVENGSCRKILFDKKYISDNIEVKIIDIFKDSDEYITNYLFDNKDPTYIYIVKPGTKIDYYLSEINTDRYSIKHDNLQNPINIIPIFPTSISTDPTSTSTDPTSTSTDIDNGVVKDNKVYILLVYLIDTEIYYQIKFIDLDNIKTLDNKDLNQLNSFNNCYKIGGEEINNGNFVECHKNGEKIDETNNKIKKCVNPNNDGCLHSKNKNVCLDNNYHDQYKRNKCRWNDEYKYCHDNIYDDKNDDKCLINKDKYSCNSINNCKYRDNLNLCVSSNLCSDYNEQGCDSNKLCTLAVINDINKCIKTPTIRNLEKSVNTQTELNEKIKGKISDLETLNPSINSDDFYKIFAQKDALTINEYLKI